MVFYLEDSKDDARGNAKEKPPPKERRLKVLRPCQTTRKAGTDPRPDLATLLSFVGKLCRYLHTSLTYRRFAKRPVKGGVRQ